MNISNKLVAVLVVVLVVAAGVGYLYFPRATLSSAFAASISILNTDISAQRGGAADFAPALDGDLYQNGDVVTSSQDGRAVLTFFDGSTLTVDTGSVVKVTTLNRLDDGGIQVVVEQTLGRTWASVQKLKTPDSKFEVTTPSATAAVRGTAFETDVVQRPDGTFAVTFTADEGQLLVSAVAGGQVAVPANTQVEIDSGQPAPASATPLPPQPTLRVSAPSGVGFALTGPSGAVCGSPPNKAEIFGCLQTANGVSIRRPDAGRYVVLLTTAAAVPNATLTVEAALGTNVVASRTFTRSLAAGDLVRTAFAYGADPQTVGPFEPAELITSVCGAVGAGHVFSGGTLQERVDALTAYGRANPGTSVAFVVTQTELNEQLADQLTTRETGGVALTGASAAIDRAGLHLSGSVDTPIGPLSANGDASIGAVAGRLAVSLRTLSASGPIPPAVLDQVRSAINSSASSVGDTLPFDVTRVMLQDGCLAVIGTTR